MQRLHLLKKKTQKKKKIIEIPFTYWMIIQ